MKLAARLATTLETAAQLNRRKHVKVTYGQYGGNMEPGWELRAAVGYGLTVALVGRALNKSATGMNWLFSLVDATREVFK